MLSDNLSSSVGPIKTPFVNCGKVTDSLNIKTAEIENKIKLVFMKYSDYLGNILMEILQQDESYRPDFQELQGIINDYLDNNEKEKIDTIITNPVMIKKQLNF